MLEVVAIMTLSGAQGGAVLALQSKTKIALEEKFGEDSLRDFANSTGLYQGKWQALTNSEGIAILKYSNLERAKAAILAARQEASAGDIQSTPQGELAQGTSYSIGSSRIADVLQGDAIARIKNPQRRIRAMQRISHRPKPSHPHLWDLRFHSD